MTEGSAGGLVYLDERQSQEVAEHIMHAIKVMRQEMDSCPFLAQRLACAEKIAELAKSIRACRPLFWPSADEVEE